MLLWDVADVVNAHLTAGQPKGSRKSAGKQKSMCCGERTNCALAATAAEARGEGTAVRRAVWSQQALATPPRFSDPADSLDWSCSGRCFPDGPVRSDSQDGEALCRPSARQEPTRYPSGCERREERAASCLSC